MTQVPPQIPSTADASAPAVLLAYQKTWISDKSPLKVIEKSRRTGLTWAEAADDVLIAASEKTAGGQNVYYIGYNQDMGIEYIEASAMWAKAFNYAASEVEEGIWEDGGDDKNIKTFTIRFPDSGHRIVALSSRPANLRGKQGVVVIDEAAFHEQLGELLKAALALLIWGGRVRVISTHNGETNAFNELIQEIRAGKRAGSVQRVDFRDAVVQGLYRRVCLRLGKVHDSQEEKTWVESVYKFYGQAADEELDVIPSQGSGVYLTRVLIERAMDESLPVLKWSCNDAFATLPDEDRAKAALDWCRETLLPLLSLLPRDRKHFFGEDFARSANLTVLYPGTQQENLHLRVPFVVELFNVPFREQEIICFYLLDRLPNFMHGAFDSRGNGQYLGERAMQRYGTLLISQVMLSESWYREEMPKWKAHFEDGTIHVPKNDEHLDDYRAIKLVRGVPKIPDKQTGVGEGASGIIRHGDAAIASAMMVFASRMDAGPVNLVSRGRRTAHKLLEDFAA